MSEISSVTSIKTTPYRWPRGSWLLFTCRAFLLFIGYAAVSQYTFQPFAEHIGSVTFDETADSLLHGEVFLHDGSKGDVFVANGHAITYMGPFPSLLRIPLNAAFRSEYGRWSPLSCLLAAIISVVFFSLAGQNALNKGCFGARPLAVCALEIGLALGTPIFFLLSIPWMYHEAALWGLAGFSMSFWAVCCNSQKHARTIPILLACGFSIALTSRAIFALSAGTPVMAYAFQRMSSKRMSKLDLFALLILSSSLSFQGWINWKKWGNPLIFQDMTMYYGFIERPGIFRALAPQGEFNIHRFPTIVSNYFAPAAANFSLRWPYVKTTLKISDAQVSWFPNGSESCVPITLSAAWLLAMIPFCFRRRSLPLKHAAFAAFQSSGAMVQAMLILMYFYISPRYTADLLPLLLFLAVASAARLRPNEDQKKFVVGSFLLLTLSVATTVLSTFDWIGSKSWDPAPGLKAWLYRSGDTTSRSAPRIASNVEKSSVEKFIKEIK